jgi:hypothetical protein
VLGFRVAVEVGSSAAPRAQRGHAVAALVPQRVENVYGVEQLERYQTFTKLTTPARHVHQRAA